MLLTEICHYCKTLILFKWFWVRKVEALSDFTGEQDGDLSFKKGEILTVIKTRCLILLIVKTCVTVSVVSYGKEMILRSNGTTVLSD